MNPSALAVTPIRAFLPITDMNETTLLRLELTITRTNFVLIKRSTELFTALSLAVVGALILLTVTRLLRRVLPPAVTRVLVLVLVAGSVGCATPTTATTTAATIRMCLAIVRDDLGSEGENHERE